ncbi:TPA: type II CRISPR RNA-guided endonuclease Cas9, partial [Streptococcus suis]
TGKYEFLGIKYSDLSFEKGTGEYGISQEKYDSIKIAEGVAKKSIFKFTLYKQDLLFIKDIENNFGKLLRFTSKNDTSKHYVELKPYDKNKFGTEEPLLPVLGNVAKSGRCIKGLNKSNISIYKVRTDILGYRHFIKQEGEHPQLKFKK